MNAWRQLLIFKDDDSIAGFHLRRLPDRSSFSENRTKRLNCMTERCEFRAAFLFGYEQQEGREIAPTRKGLSRFQTSRDTLQQWRRFSPGLGVKIQSSAQFGEQRRPIHFSRTNRFKCVEKLLFRSEHHRSREQM